MPSIAARLHQGRRDHRGEAGLAGLLHRQVDQRQLEQGADAGEEVEPRARDLGAALDVDGAEQPAELEVVARLEALGGEVAGRADRARARRSRPRRPPGASSCARLGIAMQGVLARLRRASACVGLGRLDLGGELLGADQQRGLLLARRLRDLLAERLLLGPLGLELDDRRRAAPRPPPAPRRRCPRTARACPGPHGHGRGRHGGCGGRSLAQAIRGRRRAHPRYVALDPVGHTCARARPTRAACSSRGPRCCFATVRADHSPWSRAGAGGPLRRP